MDESAITGESAPVIRESGGDRSAVTGGTRVLSDRIVVKITTQPGESFIDRMIALVEGADRQKTPNEIALNILLAGLTIAFVLAVTTLQPFAVYSSAQPVDHRAGRPAGVPGPDHHRRACCRPSASPAWTASCSATCWPCRDGRSRPPATCRRCCSTRPGTITYGNRMASEFLPVGGERRADPRRGGPAVEPGRRDARGPLHRHPGRGALRADRGRHARRRAGPVHRPDPDERHRVAGPVDPQGRRRLGAPLGRGPGRPGCPTTWPPSSSASPPRAARRWSWPRARTILGVIHLKDTVKTGIAAKFAEMRAMGIKTIMITGDNPLTAAAIAAEAGVDEFMAEATPEEKMARIRRGAGRRQPGGHDRGRHQRRPRTGPGRRRGGHEHRHPGGQRGRQHGRPRQRPDQAHGRRRDRQAAADHPRRRSPPSRWPTTWPSTSPSSRPCSRACSRA